MLALFAASAHGVVTITVDSGHFDPVLNAYVAPVNLNPGQ